MTEIWFYHLQRQPLERVLPSLIEKSLEKGWRVAVQARSEQRLDALDSWLWTYSDTSFLAHGRARDGDPELQPIYLTVGPENPSGAAFRLFIEGAEMAPALAEAGAAYARVVAVFDGNNVEEGRRILNDAALPVVHLEETMDGAARRAAELAAAAV